MSRSAEDIKADARLVVRYEQLAHIVETFPERPAQLGVPIVYFGYAVQDTYSPYAASNPLELRGYEATPYIEAFVKQVQAELGARGIGYAPIDTSKLPR